MPRSPRGTLGDGVFHVTARGNARAAIFLDDTDYHAFLRLLASVTGRNGWWRVHAYCLMPNHFHLVVESRGQALSSGMRALNGGYARYFNDRYDRSGHVFQGRALRRAPRRGRRALQRSLPVRPGESGARGDV